MPFKQQVEKLTELKRQIEVLAPRNNEGEIQKPFITWVKDLTQQITKAERWLSEGGDAKWDGEAGKFTRSKLPKGPGAVIPADGPAEPGGEDRPPGESEGESEPVSTETE